MQRLALFSGLLLAACGGSTTAPATTPPPDEAEPVAAAAEEVAPEPSALLAEVVAAEDRQEADRAMDDGRRPAEVLSFFGIERGQRVADLFAGTGYTTELLARAVGPEGQVLAQNNAFVMDRFARGPLAERLARPGLEHVVLVERELDAPLPEDAHDLDAVIYILAYHDSVWMETDRAAMNRAVFDALRPGGVYGIVDHAAEAGSGVRDVRTLHRIEESVVIDEITAAGFRLDARASTLRNPEDARDWNAAPGAAGERRGTSDRFTLRFVRP
ncbi:MAG: class I SAM-dependent methyltransferase [Sandaracinaceae bacterium]|nr:class I SAM-dependent methyltransferase [Sandaracinaceae bacterium]